jgi:hypothetical protein
MLSKLVVQAAAGLVGASLRDEFTTGETTLALHLADPEHPAGSVRLGLCVPDLRGSCARLTAHGVRVTKRPELLFGTLIAEFLDSEQAGCRYSEIRVPINQTTPRTDAQGPQSGYSSVDSVPLCEPLLLSRTPGRLE